MQGPSAECSAKTSFRELSAAAKAAILERHNELRRRVAKGEEEGGINPPQPQAANMRKLVRAGAGWGRVWRRRRGGRAASPRTDWRPAGWRPRLAASTAATFPV